MRRFFLRLAALVRPGRAERELAREVAAHLTLLEDDFLRRGMGPREARLAALRAYGGVEQAKEMHRDARSFVWMEQLLQDVRHALRSLWKSPRFAAVALLSLAFGIGVNTAIFTLVNGILLKKLPVRDPQRMVRVACDVGEIHPASFSYPVFRGLQGQSAIFDMLAAFQGNTALVDTGGGAERMPFSVVTGSYFALFEGRPALGRLIDEEDDRVEGAHPVCVISHRFWKSRFAGDASVLGRTIRVNGVPLQVIGVAAPEFIGADLQRRDDVWVPTSMSADLASRRDSANIVWLGIMGRLAPGVTQGEARARIAAASSAIEAALPKDAPNLGAVYRLRDGAATDRRGDLRDPLTILMGAVTLVLLVACANLANLILARTGERQQEFAIKLSLGISRWRLLRQLLIETFAVTLAGGALAFGVSVLLTEYLLDLFSGGRSYMRLQAAPDRGVLLYTLGACLLTAVLSGLYPAIQASRTDLARRLAAAMQLRRSFVRRGLILVQVTLAVVLLYGASLFTHSLRKLKTLDLGFDVRHALSVDLTSAGPRRNLKPSLPSPQMTEVLERVRQLPQVESAAFASPGVLAGGMMVSGVDVTDSSGAKRRIDNVMYRFVGAGFFRTLDTPMLKGREFTAADRGGAPRVAIINQKLASLMWPGADPIGRQVNGFGDGKSGEIVGVAGNSRYRALRESTQPIVYLPFDQMMVLGGTLEVRCRGEQRAVERDVRQIVKSAAPAFTVASAASMELLRDGIISQERLLAFLSSLFGALGTVLAMVGIYGLISYAVTQRTREVGIRMSIGAQRSEVLWLFLRESVALVAAGMMVGLPVALGLSRFLEKMLYEVSAKEPLDIVVTLVCLAVGGIAASWLPGRRATRIDPVQALRYD